MELSRWGPGIDFPGSYDLLIISIHEQNSYKQVNYDKIKEVTQDTDENATVFFLNCHMEAMIKCTNLNPASQEGHIFLHLHFISQSAPNI
jgi:hypothetical protein